MFLLVWQVNKGQMLYQHVDREDTAWNAQDSFTFTVSSVPAVLGPEEFRVTISYEINEPSRQSHLLANTGSASMTLPVTYPECRDPL